ncbi:hypothetical protein HDC90_004793 [Pedobacter sp. AK013]|uniref:hypothetical protein n=1 Tax=Pedobacter sp. AK013 TaxID=2723071 RepID=UPI00161976E0|nr:hypothetical protein [Pedobacter sp. AK013]MBB6240129.1 hypothetical protein [Pedobacter sp. AK013]
MSDKKLTTKHYILGGIILLLLFTNPSATALKSHLDNPNGRIVKNFNGLIFSVYYKKAKDRYGDYTKKEYYLGILGNFINITRD